MKKVVVVGGGISGMYAALRLKSEDPNCQVVLLETQSKLGGLLSGIDTGEYSFDTGVHTFYETGNSELDRVLYSVTPEGGWLDLVGTKRDLGGAYFGGAMHYGNAYLGFDHLTDSELQILEKEFLALPYVPDRRPDIASDYLVQRFGNKLATNHLFPLVRKFAGREANSVHSNVAAILPLSRLNLMSDKIDSQTLAGDIYNSRLAFSNQRMLPEALIPSRKAFYPKLYGTQRYVDAFERKLLQLGVDIRKSVKINAVTQSKIILESSVEFEFDALIWTPNPITFSKFVQTKMRPQQSAPIQKTAIVSYLVSREPNMQDLYYGYSLESSHLTHRFSSPFTFCENSKISDYFRLTNEVVFQNAMTLEEIELASTSELTEMGVLEKGSIKFCNVSLVPSGYPDLSYDLVTRTLENIELIKQEISDSIHFVGMLSKPDLFFQNDILVNTHETVESLR